MNIPERISVEDFVKNTLNQVRNGVQGQTLGNALISVSFELGVEAVHSSNNKNRKGVSLAVAFVSKGGYSDNKSSDNRQTEYNRVSFTVMLEVDSALSYKQERAYDNFDLDV